MIWFDALGESGEYFSVWWDDVYFVFFTEFYFGFMELLFALYFIGEKLIDKVGVYVH